MHHDANLAEVYHDLQRKETKKDDCRHRIPVDRLEYTCKKFHIMNQGAVNSRCEPRYVISYRTPWNK